MRSGWGPVHTPGGPDCEGRWRDRRGRWGSGQQTATHLHHTHTHTHAHTHIPGMKQVFNKPLVDESINSWTKCE